MKVMSSMRLRKNMDKKKNGINVWRKQVRTKNRTKKKKQKNKKQQNKKELCLLIKCLTYCDVEQFLTRDSTSSNPFITRRWLGDWILFLSCRIPSAQRAGSRHVLASSQASKQWLQNSPPSNWKSSVRVRHTAAGKLSLLNDRRFLNIWKTDYCCSLLMSVIKCLGC